MVNGQSSVVNGQPSVVNGQPSVVNGQSSIVNRQSSVVSGGCSNPSSLSLQPFFTTTQAIREEIAQVIPQYAGIQHLKEAGDQFQYGGSHLCFGWNFATADGKAHFTPLSLPQRELPEGYFRVTTRRGKQFNSMVQAKKDMITGAFRDAIYMSHADAEALGLTEGDRIRLTNEQGQFEGRVFLATLKPGNLQVHWPEGNGLLDRSKRSQEGVPDYNAIVQLESINKHHKAS
ncbi:hypothetical protein H6G89_15035 [Oscillatoria sp. FACHB-1407]|nr:hypothetical protein [Oscillatoria sp. FACHB-1407]